MAKIELKVLKRKEIISQRYSRILHRMSTLPYNELGSQKEFIKELSLYLGLQVVLPNKLPYRFTQTKYVFSTF